MKNLDLLAAKAAQTIIDETTRPDIKATEVENVITKALGVLQEDGVYAALLYLYSRGKVTERPIVKSTREKLLDLMKDLALSVPASKDAEIALKFLTDHVCNDLDRLLLVKQLWEQTLIYARYGAKARGAAEEAKP